MHNVTRTAGAAPGLTVGAVPSSPQSGVVTSTSLCAGGTQIQHAERIVVTTPLTAGGTDLQHAEGIVVSTLIVAGGLQTNHAEAVVASSPAAATVSGEAVDATRPHRRGPRACVAPPRLATA